MTIWILDDDFFEDDYLMDEDEDAKETEMHAWINEFFFKGTATSGFTELECAVRKQGASCHV